MVDGNRVQLGRSPIGAVHMVELGRLGQRRRPQDLQQAVARLGVETRRRCSWGPRPRTRLGRVTASGSQYGKDSHGSDPKWFGRKALVRWNQSTDVPVWWRFEKLSKQLDWDLQSRFEHVNEQVLGPAQLLADGARHPQRHRRRDGHNPPINRSRGGSQGVRPILGPIYGTVGGGGGNRSGPISWINADLFQDVCCPCISIDVPNQGLRRHGMARHEQRVRGVFAVTNDANMNLTNPPPPKAQGCRTHPNSVQTYFRPNLGGPPPSHPDEGGYEGRLREELGGSGSAF